MIDTLVVVAHHNNGPALMRWLEHSEEMRPGTKMLVVDTGSPKEMLASFQTEVNVAESFDNVLGLVSTPYRGYDTGAYLWAYWNCPASNYLFVQDSCSPREPDYVRQFAERMPGEMGAVGWSSFDIRVWDSDDQAAATAWMYGDQSKWPAKGIFGPIFYTSRKTLDHMAAQGLLPMPPVHKQQQQAMERAWAILLHRAGVRVNFLVDEDMPRGGDMARGNYPALTKTFPVRA